MSPAEVPALFVEILILFKAIERDKVTVKIPKFRANFHRALKCEVPDETYLTYLAQNCSYRMYLYIWYLIGTITFLPSAQRMSTAFRFSCFLMRLEVTYG